MTRDEVRSWTKRLSSQKGKPAAIIFTSGAFDLIHPGHIEYLHSAALIEGDVNEARCPLVVGVNTDDSVRSYKKPNVVDRPFNTLEYRMQAVAALGCVDFVFPFEEKNNNTNIEKLKPKYYVKGGDYTKDKLSSAPLVESYGGSVAIIPIVADYSTTNIMRRLVSEARKRNLQD